jgi:hypothetical protein
MAKISRFRPTNLSFRRSISFELPEFLLRAFECRVADANDGASSDERVTLEHLVEIELAGSLSLSEVAHLECRIPGISVAVSRWLNDIE